MNKSELRDKTVSGVRWTALSRLVYEVLAFGTNILLVRLVSPTETGVAAVALVVPMLASILSFEGFGSALVQRKTITTRDEGVALALALGTGAVLTAVTASTAYLAGPAIFGQSAADLLTLVSVSFLLASFSTVPRARLQRSLSFGHLSLNDVYGFAANVAVAIPLAATGSGGIALVAGVLAGQMVSSIALVAAAGLPAPRFEREPASWILRYGLPASAAGVIYSGRKALPWIFLGATFPPALVGQFYRAYQLGAEYQAKVSNVMLAVVFPLFSRAEDRSVLSQLRGRIVRVNGMVIAPALGLLVVAAPEVVHVMYGDRWEGAVESTRILAGVGLASVLMAGTEAVTLALGRPRRLLAFHSVFALGYLAALLWATSTDDLVVVAVAAVGVHLGMLAYAQAFLMRPLLGLPMTELWHDAGPAVVGTVTASLWASAVADVLRQHGEPDLAVLGAAAALGAAVYLLTLRLVFPRAWNELRALPRLLRPAKPEPRRA